MKLYKNHNDILKLKKDLMSQKTTNSKSSGLSSQFYKFINKENGNNFEINVKNILEMKYKWKKTNINRKFLYTEINIDEDNIILTNHKEKIIKINNQEIKFYVNKEKDLIIKIDKKKKKIMKYNTQNNDNIINLFGKEINEEDNFNISVLEIKLNKKKIEELLSQLKKDKKIMENYYNEKILCIGIVNSASVDKNILNKFLKENDDLKIIILGFKNSIFDERDIKQFYDWKSIKKIDNLEKEIKDLKEDVKEEVQDLREEVKDLKEDVKKEVKELKEDVSKIFNILNTFKYDFLKKKRKRRKKSKEKNDNKNKNKKKYTKYYN